MRFRKKPKGEALESGEIDAGPDERYPRKTAYNKMMDYLARRSYSEFELRQKLLQDYAEDDVDNAIERAKESGWITPPEEMAEKVAAELGRKRKGHRFINQFLKHKGLPPVSENADEELAKARELLEARLKHDFSEGPLPRELFDKAQRILFNRGFSGETIRRALAR